MDIHQLELFLAVMDSPSMTRAAEKIHLSPGAVNSSYGVANGWSPRRQLCAWPSMPKK